MPRKNPHDSTQGVHPIPVRDRREPSSPSEARVRFEMPTEEIQQLANRIALHIRMENWERCHAIIDEAQREAAERAKAGSIRISQRQTLATPLAQILSTRTANYLEGKGILTLGQALEQEEEDLKAIPGFGPAAIAEIKTAAAKLGITANGNAARRPS